MKWFGRKSAGRASARPAQSSFPLGVAGVRLPVLGDWPRSYEAQVREGYLNNAIAQRAVRLIAEGVASLRVRATDDAALALVNATSAGQVLLETVSVHLLLHGNAYVELLTGPDGRPCELYALRPDRMTIEADARGWPAAFIYRVGTNTSRMAAENVIHIRTMHPLDDHYGLGCLGAASGAVAVHNAAAKWNKALLDNAARPSGALVHDAAEAMSAEQFARLKEELKDGFQGAINAGRPMLLEGGLKWQSLSLSPADMDFVGLKSAAAREIALAFGVPPMLLGLPGDATYANYREANKALWRQAILPLAAKIVAALGEGLRSWFAGLSLDIDLEGLPALSEDRERLWAQASAADFLTLDEKRALAGYAALEVEAAAAATVEQVREVPAEIGAGTDGTETKFNPWHDPANGQFTFTGNGGQSGGVGEANMSRPPNDTSKRRPRGTQPQTRPEQSGRRPASEGPKAKYEQSLVVEIPGYVQSGKDKWRSSNDQIFIDAVNEFNRENGLTPDNPRYQYATTLKAQAMVESGGNKEAFLRDPLQFNNLGDAADDKVEVTGVGSGQAMTPVLSARAALKWIDYKSFERPAGAAFDSPRLYRGKAFGLRRYNGNKKYKADGVTQHRDWYVDRVLRLSILANEAWRARNPLIPMKK